MMAKTKARISGLALTAGIMMLAAPAHAHPHAWIDASTAFHLNDANEVTALTVTWVFDPAYSAFATEGLDKDGDGEISPAELRPLATQNLTSLKDYDYFTEIKKDGRQVAYDDVTDYSSAFDGLQLSMEFTIPLTEPVYVKTHAITYALFDPTYYVEILHHESNPIAVDGDASAGCSPELVKPDLDSLPISLAEMSEPTFAEEPREDGLSYGALFAERVHLICN